MILIIEGMDRCGKTTLVESLRKNYFLSPKILVHHSSSPPRVSDKNAWEREHYRHLITSMNFLSHEGYDIIFDRFHLGAIVYGAKYRGADPAEIYNIDRHYMGNFRDVAMVLLTDYPESIVARNDGESLETTKSDFEETHDAFIEAYNNSCIMNKLHINVTDNRGFSNTYDTVTEFLNRVRMN